MSETVRIIAAVITILGGGYLGMLAAARFDVRVRQLDQLRLALGGLEFSIGFLKLPLANAIDGAAKAREGAIRDMLLSASKDIESGISPSAALERAILKSRPRLALKSDDIEIITEFAIRLGTGDTSSELCNIKAASVKLKLAYDEAVSERDSKAKLWRGVGLLAGCFAVIMLI